MIGDPSGKSQERMRLTLDQIDANLDGIRPQLAQFLDFDRPDNPARVVNNADWLPRSTARISARHGKYFTVLHAAEGVGAPPARERGWHSYTEFSDLLLQARDFLDCSIGMAATCRWAAAISGATSRPHRTDSQGARAKAHGLVTPLVTTASGAKFGKTRSRHHLARSGAHAPERVPELLAQHRRSRRDRVLEVLHVSDARRDRRSRGAYQERPEQERRAAGAGGERHDAGARRRRRQPRGVCERGALRREDVEAVPSRTRRTRRTACSRSRTMCRRRRCRRATSMAPA